MTHDNTLSQPHLYYIPGVFMEQAHLCTDRVIFGLALSNIRKIYKYMPHFQIYQKAGTVLPASRAHSNEKKVIRVELNLFLKV